MNKIYKVIWSKVKHQYVVVSELAHSNGKQSRTSRNSIRSRIAALVVCGAITAFGAFGALPMDSVYAADSTVQQATQTQYVAFKAGANDRIGRTKNFGDTSNPAWYTCTSVRIDENTTVKYWVRNGYKLEVEPDAPYIPERLMLREDGKVVDYRINAVLENPELLESQQPILQTTQSFSTGTNTQTTRGDSLEKIEVGYYAGVSNSAGVGTDGTWNYIIDPKMNGNFDDYIDTNPTQATNVKDSGYWKEVTERAGSYYLGNQKVDSKNVYVIDGETGVFVTTPNGNEVYTGKVYGSHNEILMTGKDENGNYYSYWAAKSDDDNVSIGDSDLTLGDYRNNLQTLERNDRKLAAADIKSVKVDTGNNRINLITNTQFDENGEPIEGTEGTITGFSVNSIKNTGEDTKIQFSDGENNKFDVDAGSRVVATKFDENEKVSELSINGETYAIGGGETYTNGNGIAIDDKNDNKISVVTGNGLGIEDGKVVAKAGTNVTIDENGINAKDTTLVGGEITPTTSEDGYENTYEIKDTDENKAILKDVASATKLSSVDSKVGDTQYTSTNYIANGQNLTTAASNLDSAIKGNENKIGALDGRVVNVENDTITGGSIDTDGKINLRQKDGTSITTDNAIHDWKVTDANLDENGTLTLNTENAYGGDTGSVTVDNIASRGYVTNQIDANNTTITQQYENYFNTNDKYLSGATFDNNSGELKLTVAKAGENGAAQEYSFDLGKYVEGKDVYVNQISIDKENNKLILNRKNATSLELGLEELSSIGVSSSDYQLIGSGDGTGTYTPDESGNISLQVKDSVSGEVRTVQLTDVASANTLKTVSDRVGDTNYSSTNYIHNEDNLTTAASTLDSAIKATADKVDAGWALYSDGNKIKDVKPGDNWISVDAGENVSISKNENGNGLTISADLKDLDVEDTNAVLYDDDDKTTVTLAGTNGTRITNVAKGDISEKSTEAVNGSQLYATNQKVDAGWTATDGKTGITVSPTNNTLKFAGDNNIAVTADAENNAINVELNPDVNLKGEGKNSDNRVWLSGSNGTITVTTENNLSEKTTVINGGNVYVGSSVSVGDKVEITDKDITGLSNTSWNGTTDDESRAATEGQLKDISTTVNAGWTATDSNGNSIVVNPENKSTLNFAGDNNIAVTADAENNAINVELNPDVNLKGEGKNSDNRVWLSGSNGTITVTTENNLSEKTTVINGGNVYVGSSVSVGDKVEITDKDITGLSNTSWNGTTDDESRAATEGQLKDISTTVNAGWTATDSNGASIVVNPENGSTLNFAGDRNIEVKANKDNNSIDVSLSDDVVLGGKEGTSRVEIGGTNGTIMATKDPNSMAATTTIDGGNVYVGSSISVGDKVEITDKDITGLSNTEWNGTTTTPDRAATEGQLQSVATEAAKHTTVSGDENITVKHEEGSQDYQVTLNPDVTLKGDNSSIELNGTKGTMQVNQETTEGTDFTNINGNVVSIGYTNKEGTKNAIVIDGGEGTITGLSNTTWDGKTDNASRVATEGQLEDLSDTVNTGWIATDSQNHEVNITPDNNKLNFAGDENITVTAANNEIKTTLNDDIVLGDYLNGDDGVLIGGSSGTISATNSITVGEDQGLIIDGQKKEIQGLSNTTWNEKIANDAAVEGSTAASTAATQGQLQEVSKVANAGWTASDGTNSISVKPNETLNFVGDENLTVSADGTDKELKVSLNDDITLGDGENAIKIDGTNGTLNIGSTFAVAEDGTVLSDGDVIADADGEKYSLSEVGKYAVRYDKTNDGTSTITLADGDDLSGTRIKNVADGVDPKDAVNVSQLEAVEATANAGWTASDGTNSISIKPNETLNFVGDENLTVSADGTDKKLKVSLNDDITLGNTEAGNTEGERSFTINTTDPNGYVPESYKTGSGANFIEENGGFMLFATDTQGFGVFGVTAKGSAWARDFKTYTTDIYGNNTQYSLNEVGDAVAQMSSYYNGKNSYTVFSRYLNEAEKDNPFVTVDEDGNTINATRDIPLALRDDGAVLIGATIKGEDFTDNGIRINAETKTTYDENGNEVTNNIATITGLENTEWKPPTPVATFAANDGSATVTSRAATESQLNDLYSAVAAYDVNVDGTIDYSHIALAGTPYGASRSGNGTHTGGTSITNVAYASGKDGSEAVNVDYLNDAINNAVKDGGAISDSDRHLQEGTYHVNDQGKVELIVADEKGENQSTVTIDNIANKNDITNLDNKIDNTFNDLNDKINNIDNVETDVKGGNINEDGTISLKTENEDGTTTNVTLKGQLTDSGVVQEGTTFDKETGTLTITSQDKYSGETSSVTVEGIASTEVVGATTKEDLATAYKDADKDGNATTEYITDSESMVEADVALDHAIQDVAGTSYANDMVLSNRIDSVEKRLGNVEERIDKVGAMAAAIANLRTMGFDPEAPTEIAIGVGQYKSETGIAIGVFHYPNQDFMLSASLSSSGDELMGGIGATWKLGRKSAAERAKDEEARHLEQAEEMKKLAQQEKVKAQAQRHAKLLAERQQASQKNA